MNTLAPQKSCCPHCGHDLQGDPIPEEDREAFGGHSHFYKAIAVSAQGIGDGALLWGCPECGKTWHRWESGPMRERAERWMSIQDAAKGARTLAQVLLNLPALRIVPLVDRR